jgi:hypothetical protein
MQTKRNMFFQQSLFIALLCGGLLMSGGGVRTDAFSTVCGTFIIGLDKASYAPGETITATGSGIPDPVVTKAWVNITANGQPVPTSDKAPTTPGNYSVAFYADYGCTGQNGKVVSYSEDVSVEYTVVGSLVSGEYNLQASLDKSSFDIRQNYDINSVLGLSAIYVSDLPMVRNPGEAQGSYRRRIEADGILSGFSGTWELKFNDELLASGAMTPLLVTFGDDVVLQYSFTGVDNPNAKFNRGVSGPGKVYTVTAIVKYAGQRVSKVSNPTVAEWKETPGLPNIPDAVVLLFDKYNNKYNLEGSVSKFCEILLGTITTENDALRRRQDALVKNIETPANKVRIYCGTDDPSVKKIPGFVSPITNDPLLGDAGDANDPSYPPDGNGKPPTDNNDPNTIGSSTKPTLSLSAQDQTIQKGSTATIAINAGNAKTCWGYGGDGQDFVSDWLSPSQKTVKVSPLKSSCYIDECWDAQGVSTGAKTIIITVQGDTSVPKCQMSYLPTLKFSSSQTSDGYALTWKTKDVDSCWLYGGELAPNWTPSVNTTITVHPKTSTDYFMKCWSPSGKETGDWQRVSILIEGTSLPAPVIPQKPVIQLSEVPTAMSVNAHVSWKTSYAVRCAVTNDQGIVAVAKINDEIFAQTDKQKVQNFRLECWNERGESSGVVAPFGG